MSGGRGSITPEQLQTAVEAVRMRAPVLLFGVKYVPAEGGDPDTEPVEALPTLGIEIPALEPTEQPEPEVHSGTLQLDGEGRS